METTTLTPVLTKPGPYATVLVDVSQDSEIGRHHHLTRVRAACADLAAQGAPREVVERIAACLEEQTATPAPVARLVVSTPEEIVYDQLAILRHDRAAPRGTRCPTSPLGRPTATRRSASSSPRSTTPAAT